MESPQAKKVVKRRATQEKAAASADSPKIKASTRRQVVNELIDLEDDSVKDFLAEIRDENPTDIVDLPEKESKKQSRKNKRAARKAAKGKKKRHIVRNILLVLLILIVGAGVAAYFYLDDFVKTITDDGSLLGLIFSDPDTPLEKDASGRTNILVFGTEGWDMSNPDYDGADLTDSMILLSLNQETGDIKAISLPRDLKSHTCTSTSKLNEMYWCNSYNISDKKEAEKAGAEALKKEFENILGVQVHYYAHANWLAVVRIVDALDGVDVVFTYDGQTWDGDETIIETTSPDGIGDIGLNGSYKYEYKNRTPYHLNGHQALDVARTRNAFGGYGASGGNFSREYFQQRIIEAIAKKARQKNIDLTTVMQLKSAIGDNLRTNFKDTEIKTLLHIAMNTDVEHLQTISLLEPGDNTPRILTTGMLNGISYVLPTAGAENYTQIRAYVKKKLNDTFGGEEASLVVLNGTSAYGLAASEKTNLEDMGFSVKTTSNAPEDQSDFDGIRVYQVKSKTPKTAAKLAEYYKTELIKSVPESLSDYDCDYIIVLGNGYSTKK